MSWGGQIGPRTPHDMGRAPHIAYSLFPIAYLPLDMGRDPHIRGSAGRMSWAWVRQNRSLEADLRLLWFAT